MMMMTTTEIAAEIERNAVRRRVLFARKQGARAAENDSTVSLKNFKTSPEVFAFARAFFDRKIELIREKEKTRRINP